jgi:GNAT superfamily N-acetyltransferase
VDAARTTIQRLEEIAANAVPAEVIQIVDGWLLRASPATLFRRINSVLPMHGDAHELDQRIALVESFYRRRGLPVRYQLSPVAAPAGLEQELAARGYEVEAPVTVQTASAAVVAATPLRADRVDVVLRDDVDAASLASDAAARGADAPAQSRLAAYARLLGRIGPRAAAALAALPGVGAAGAGFVVVERGWAGIFGMATYPGARRRGVAAAVLHALACHARAGGATRLYLQVEQGNEAARALYARAGFEHAYAYHYRSAGLREAAGRREDR